MARGWLALRAAEGGDVVEQDEVPAEGTRALPGRALTAVAVTGWLLVVLQAGVLGADAVAGPLPQILVLLSGAVVPTLLVALLATVLARAATAAAPTPASPAAVAAEREPGGATSQELAPAPAAAPEQAPVWQPDEASGAVWTTAGEAARGVEAARWGTAEDAAGWTSPSAWGGPEEPPGPPGQGRDSS